VSAVDVALFTRLHSSPAVTAAAPGGVYWEEALGNPAMPYVIINLQHHEDNYQMEDDGPSYEVGRYLVKAVGSNATAVGVAYAAIHATLQNQQFNIPGYELMVCRREERHRYPEESGSARYHHRAGIYAIWASR
jgi:hypothetical protein